MKSFLGTVLVATSAASLVSFTSALPHPGPAGLDIREIANIDDPPKINRIAEPHGLADEVKRAEADGPPGGGMGGPGSGTGGHA